jgi:hypothetical protein
MARYLLKAGSHLMGSGKDRKKYNHAKDNVIETDENLAAVDPNKFERIEDRFQDSGPFKASESSNRPAFQPTDLKATTAHQINRQGKTLDDRYGELDTLQANDLKQIAEAEEIPVPKGATKKEDILAAIRQHEGKTHDTTKANAPQPPPQPAQESKGKGK